MNNIFSQEVYDLIDDLDFGEEFDDYNEWPPSRGPGGPRGPDSPHGPSGPIGPGPRGSFGPIGSGPRRSCGPIGPGPRGSFGPGGPGPRGSCGPGGPGGPRGPTGPGWRIGMSNNDYNNAYGNYCGGYGPGGGFAPRRDPPIPSGPPDFCGPLGPPRRLGPCGPPSLLQEGAMWGRGFGPGGPPLARNASPDVRAFRYQLRCGVSKDVVKTLPKQMLVLMEPEYCGVCAIEFDSFIMSRLHYSSRNHAKNQKKWMSQNADSSGGGKKEIPLKSRDLYCELCDVQITSKAHAESHYAGKPHRAIVFGRKKPKNPYLLQPGLEARAEQLIRREKKFIKADKGGEEDSAKEPKPEQSELYCSICKTSMTCSEQMTMHLNGKKHLSKEKQHIIRVMNSGDSENGNGQAEAAAEPSENKAAEVTQVEDWENGSGAWE